MKLMLRSIVLGLVVMVLGACQTSTTMRAGPAYHISEVRVANALQVTPATNLAAGVKAQALATTRHYPRSGEAKILRVTLTSLHYKNAMMSLLFGDSNRLIGFGTVIDKKTGQDEGSFTIAVADAAVLQGMIGALSSVTEQKKKIETRLVQKFGQDAVRLGYYGRLQPTAKVRTKMLRARQTPRGTKAAAAGSS